MSYTECVNQILKYTNKQILNFLILWYHKFIFNIISSFEIEHIHIQNSN